MFKPVRAITAVQQETLNCIIESVCERGFQPSMQEMAVHFSITRKAVRDRLVQLARKGYIQMPRCHQQRCYRIRGVKFRVVRDDSALPETAPDA